MLGWRAVCGSPAQLEMQRVSTGSRQIERDILLTVYFSSRAPLNIASSTSLLRWKIVELEERVDFHERVISQQRNELGSGQ
jgi:hypothetical protein